MVSAYAQDCRRSSIWGLRPQLQGLPDFKRTTLLGEEGHAVCICCPPLPFLSPVSYLKFSPSPDIWEVAPGSPLQGCCSQTKWVENSEGIKCLDGM